MTKRRIQVQDRPPDGPEHLGPPKSPVNRREYGPGQHGQRRKGKLSDFGVQLKAKQKLRAITATSPRSSSAASMTRPSA